jgi:hypothetical protein
MGEFQALIEVKEYIPGQYSIAAASQYSIGESSIK